MHEVFDEIQPAFRAAESGKADGVMGNAQRGVGAWTDEAVAVIEISMGAMTDD